MDNPVTILENVPIGFRFHPTDEELVDYYLKHKLLNDDFPVYIIPDIELCKVEPWDVPAKSVIRSHDPEWFFFSPIDYKYSGSKRFKRKTEHGLWKSTGKDRTIKRKDTGSVIGTKKTLVFRNFDDTSRGNVKSDWVIHEYHATTFHESQTTFVLCRLMKKTEKIFRGKAAICDEGEPSRLPAPDYENQPSPTVSDESSFGKYFWTPSESENYSLPFQVSPPLPNAYSGNENNNMQTTFETAEEQAKFPDGFLAEEFVLDACVYSIQFDSLSGVHNKSSDTDAEAPSSLHGNPVDTSSCDLSPDKSLETNYFEISSSPSTLRRQKSKYHPGPDNFMSQRSVARRSQTLRNVSTNAASHIEVEKKLPVVESQKDQKKAQNSSFRENLETRSHQSSDINRKGSFIILETPSSSQNLFPRSVYLVNVAIGIMLLIAISWEVLSC